MISGLDGLHARTSLHNCGIHSDNCEVEPKDLAILDGIQADPLKHARFVDTHFEGDNRGSTVQKVEPPKVSSAMKIEATNPIARDAVQIIVLAGKRKTHQLGQFFLAPRQLLAKAKQAKSVLAKGVDTY